MSGDDGQDSGRQGRRQRDHGFPFSIFITPVQMQRPEPAAFTPPTGAAAVFSAASVAPAAAVAPAAVVVPAEAVVPAAAPDPREPTPQVRRGRGGISFRAAPDRRNYPSSTMESINSERVLAVSSRVIVTAPISPPMPRAAGNAPASSAEATAPLDLCNGHNIWDNHFTSGQRTWSQFGGQTLDEEPATAAPALDPVASSASSTAAAAASPVPSRQNVSNSDDSSFSIPQMSWGPSGGFYRELEDDAPRRTRRPAPRRVAPPLSHSTLGTSRRGNSAFWDYYNVVRERSPLGSSNRESINRAPRSSAAASVNIAAATSNVPRQHGPMPGTRETSGDNTDVLRGGATAAAADVPQLSSSLATVHVDGRSSSDLEDDLECYVCTEMRRGAQYLCENGHPLCHFCLSKLPNATCPMARTCGFTIPPKRNYELEEKIRRFWRDNNLKFECHWDNCTLVFKDEKQLAKHERGCTKGAKIRRYHCPAPVELCGQMFLTRRELRRHSRGCQRIVAENSGLGIISGYLRRELVRVNQSLADPIVYHPACKRCQNWDKILLLPLRVKMIDVFRASLRVQRSLYLLEKGSERSNKILQSTESLRLMEELSMLVMVELQILDRMKKDMSEPAQRNAICVSLGGFLCGRVGSEARRQAVNGKRKVKALKTNADVTKFLTGLRGMFFEERGVPQYVAWLKDYIVNVNQLTDDDMWALDQEGVSGPYLKCSCESWVTDDDEMYLLRWRSNTYMCYHQRHMWEVQARQTFEDMPQYHPTFSDIEIISATEFRPTDDEYIAIGEGEPVSSSSLTLVQHRVEQNAANYTNGFLDLRVGQPICSHRQRAGAGRVENILEVGRVMQVNENHRDDIWLTDPEVLPDWMLNEQEQVGQSRFMRLRGMVPAPETVPPGEPLFIPAAGESPTFLSGPFLASTSANQDHPFSCRAAGRLTGDPMLGPLCHFCGGLMVEHPPESEEEESYDRYSISSSTGDFIKDEENVRNLPGPSRRIGHDGGANEDIEAFERDTVKKCAEEEEEEETLVDRLDSGAQEDEVWNSPADPEGGRRYWELHHLNTWRPCRIPLWYGDEIFPRVFNDMDPRLVDTTFPLVDHLLKKDEEEADSKKKKKDSDDPEKKKYKSSKKKLAD